MEKEGGLFWWFCVKWKLTWWKTKIPPPPLLPNRGKRRGYFQGRMMTVWSTKKVSLPSKCWHWLYNCGGWLTLWISVPNKPDTSLCSPSHGIDTERDCQTFCNVALSITIITRLANTTVTITHQTDKCHVWYYQSHKFNVIVWIVRWLCLLYLSWADDVITFKNE